MSTDTLNNTPVSAEPVGLLLEVRTLGNYGAAYDPPGKHRAYTYDHQPGNVKASRLGNACLQAAAASGGDTIDRGLGLLRELQAQGFGVFDAESSRWHAAPVATQPDLAQQTLDDVMAGIPARDAEITALRKQVETLQAQPYSLDLDPAGIRALTADAISGALALGFQDVNPPPNNEHWLAPFWEIGRESAAQAQQPVSGADETIPRHVAATLANAIYEAAQKIGIANGDHINLSVGQCLHLLDCIAGGTTKMVDSERGAMESALAELVDKIMPGLDTGDLLADAATASKAMDAQPSGNPEELPLLPKPDSYLFQHSENGLTECVDGQQVEWGFEKNNPRHQKIGGMFTEGQMRDYARAALAQQDADKVDAERYRYLRSVGGCSWTGYKAGEDPKKHDGHRVTGDEYDAAVDASKKAG